MSDVILPPSLPTIGDSVEIEDRGSWLPGRVTRVCGGMIFGHTEDRSSAFGYAIHSYRRNWRFR